VFLRLADDVKKKAREQSARNDEINALEKRREELKKEIKALKEKKEKKEAEFLDLLKGKEWQEFNTLTRELKDVKSEILKIEYELTNELSPMKRPLKKLEHMLRKQDLLFNHKGFLRSFLQDPFGAVKTQNGEESLRKFLFTMNKMVHDNKIELKDKEMEKLDSLMERMVREIPETKKRCSQLAEKRDHMEKTLKESVIVNRKQELESEVEKYSRYISEMETETKDIAKEQDALGERIEAERKELEKLILKGTGREVDITG
jgi:chromosome segregation ATPase